MEQLEKGLKELKGGLNVDTRNVVQTFSLRNERISGYEGQFGGLYYILIIGYFHYLYFKCYFLSQFPLWNPPIPSSSLPL